MTVPKGVDTKNGTAGNCVKLNKALYGLKQASRAWNRELVRFLKQIGFKQLFTDSSVFVRGTRDSNFVIIVLHVDDQYVFATSLPLMDEFKAVLRAQYGIEDLGETKYFLGIQVTRDRSKRTLQIWQPKYIQEVLSRFDLPSFGVVTTPTYPTDFNRLSTDQCPETEEAKDAAAKLPYRQLIGSLMYLMIGTRPDLAQPLSVLS